jgi:peptidyl-prolyl cis-trans isomerase SurA
MKKKFLLLSILLLTNKNLSAADLPIADYAPPLKHAGTMDQKAPLSKKDRPLTLHSLPKRAPDQCVQIAAVVNDKIITTNDLDERVRMLLRTKIEDIPENERQKIRQDVLRQMIDEKLQLEITENAKISIADDDVERAIHYMEEQNHLEPGSILKDLKAKGISQKSIRDHFGAKIAWSRLIGYYRDTIEIGKKDLSQHLSDKETTDKTYLLAELVFHFDSILAEDATYEQASHAFMRIKNGENFSQVAHEMSHAASAASGGDIGWIEATQCEAPVQQALENLKPGEISPPIKVGNSYKIMLVRNIRYPNKLASAMTARQLEVKFSKNLSGTEKEKEQERLDGLFETIEGCDQFDQVGEQLDSELHIYKNVSLQDLSEDLQEVLTDLPEGKPSNGYRSDDRIIYFMVCKKNLEKIQTVNHEEKEDSLINQRLSAFADQKLRDLRRVAAVDIRL